MARFLARRLALTIPVLLGVAMAVFSLIHFPGAPVGGSVGTSLRTGRQVVALPSACGHAELE